MSAAAERADNDSTEDFFTRWHEEDMRREAEAEAESDRLWTEADEWIRWLPVLDVWRDPRTIIARGNEILAAAGPQRAVAIQHARAAAAVERDRQSHVRLVIDSGRWYESLLNLGCRGEDVDPDELADAMGFYFLLHGPSIPLLGDGDPLEFREDLAGLLEHFIYEVLRVPGEHQAAGTLRSGGPSRVRQRLVRAVHACGYSFLCIEPPAADAELGEAARSNLAALSEAAEAGTADPDRMAAALGLFHHLVDAGRPALGEDDPLLGHERLAALIDDFLDHAMAPASPERPDGSPLRWGGSGAVRTRLVRAIHAAGYAIVDAEVAE